MRPWWEMWLPGQGLDPADIVRREKNHTDLP